MPSKFEEFIATTIAPIVEAVLASKLTQVLEDFHTKNPEMYEASIIGGHVFIKPLIEFCKTTPTGLDDGFVEMLNGVISMSAIKNNVEFPEALPEGPELLAAIKPVLSLPPAV